MLAIGGHSLADLSTMDLQVPRATLVELLGHASSAARIVGHLDDARAGGPLSDHVDTLVHVLSELLGAPRASATLDEDDEPTEFSLRALGAGDAR
jgi:hypothetical protein